MKKKYYTEKIYLFLFITIFLCSTIPALAHHTTCPDGQQLGYYLNDDIDKFLYSTPDAACDEFGSRYVDQSPPSGDGFAVWYTYQEQLRENDGTTDYICEVERTSHCRNCQPPSNPTVVYSSNLIREQCTTNFNEPTDQCDYGTAPDMFTKETTNYDDAPSLICATNYNCYYKKGSIGIKNPQTDNWVSLYQLDLNTETSSCSEPNPIEDAPETTLDNPTEGCYITNGDQICLDDTPTNCGTINGSYTCLEDLPDNDCVFLGGSDSFVCSGTPDPLAIPDNNPADGIPDNSTSEINIDGTDISIYNTTNSYQQGNVSNPDNLGVEQGLDEVSGKLDGIEEAVEAIEDTLTDDCVGTACEPFGGEGVGQGEKDGIADGVINGIGGAGGITGSIGGIDGHSFSLASQNCPTGTFQFLGESFTIDKHCEFLLNNRDFIRALFIGVWLLLGIRILFSA